MKDEEYIKKAIQRNLCFYDYQAKTGEISVRLLYLMTASLQDAPEYLLCEKCPVICEELYKDQEDVLKIFTMTTEEIQVLKDLGVSYPNKKECYIIMVGKNGNCVAGTC